MLGARSSGNAGAKVVTSRSNVKARIVGGAREHAAATSASRRPFAKQANGDGASDAPSVADGDGSGVADDDGGHVASLRSNVAAAAVDDDVVGREAVIAAAKSGTSLVSVPWVELVCWWLLADLYFFATTHHRTFSAVQWPAGLIGLEEMNHFGSGTLVMLNTFGVYAVLPFGLPLLLVWRHRVLIMPGPVPAQRQPRELALSRSRTAVVTVASKLFVGYMLLQGVQTLSAALAAAHLR